MNLAVESWHHFLRLEKSFELMHIARVAPKAHPQNSADFPPSVLAQLQHCQLVEEGTVEPQLRDGEGEGGTT